MMRIKKTEWKKQCNRCGEIFIANGKYSYLCEKCNTGKTGTKQIKLDKEVKKELEDSIKELKIEKNIICNDMIKAHIRLIKEFNLKDKLKNIILGSKKKDKKKDKK